MMDLNFGDYPFNDYFYDIEISTMNIYVVGEIMERQLGKLKN